MKIGFQGALGAFSYIAAQELYSNTADSPGGKAEFLPFYSFGDVAAAVASGEVDRGVIPIENSYAGRVAEVHNIFPQIQLHIVAEKIVKIEHCLAVVPGAAITDIKHVHSHEQALMQCKKSIAKLSLELNQDLQQNQEINTAKAAEVVSKLGNFAHAALCSKMAADICGLEVLIEGFQDVDDNYTTFVSLAREPLEPEVIEGGKIITTVLFAVRNIPAAIYKALGGFATNSVDLLKLESYIPGGVQSHSAQFLLSFYGSLREKNVSLALEELGFFAAKVKVLGCYYADEKRQRGKL